MAEGQLDMSPAGLVLRPPEAPALLSSETAAADHFVLAHHGIARCEEAGWTLTVDGMVERPLELSISDLRKLPSRTLTVVLECAGDPENPDRPTRFVGNARWRGIPLAEVLARVGIRDGARYVWLRGGDWGSYAGVANDSYLKDIPLDRALTGEVLLAYEMNGEPLTPDHGFPLRAVVPGYYGTNSVKWLSQITLAAERAQSLFTTRLYNLEVNGELRPVWAMSVNSCVVEPADGAKLDLAAHEIRGWAWGEREIATVEVSVDGGASWRTAGLDGRHERGWQGFRLRWAPTEEGRYTIMARAADAGGAVQPTDLHINQIQRLTVSVGGSLERTATNEEE